MVVPTHLRDNFKMVSPKKLNKNLALFFIIIYEASITGTKRKTTNHWPSQGALALTAVAHHLPFPAAALEQGGIAKTQKALPLAKLGL